MYKRQGPVVEALSKMLAAGVNFMVVHDMLPLASIFVEPAKILFLNNAINHGIFSPLGIQQSHEPVSYTHLDVYKRQKPYSTIATIMLNTDDILWVNKCGNAQ